MNTLLVTYLVLTGKLASAKRREAGQGSLEYVAMIAVAALIIGGVALVAQPAGDAIGAMIQAAIDKVKAAVQSA
jgi:hypothetical protein